MGVSWEHYSGSAYLPLPPSPPSALLGRPRNVFLFPSICTARKTHKEVFSCFYRAVTEVLAGEPASSAISSPVGWAQKPHPRPRAAVMTE